jgi:hypothetical protein
MPQSTRQLTTEVATKHARKRNHRLLTPDFIGAGEGNRSLVFSLEVNKFRKAQRIGQQAPYPDAIPN